MAKASSIRQFVTSRSNANSPVLGLLKSFKLLNESSSIEHLFQVHARLITSGNFWDSSWAIRLLKCSSRFGDASYTVSIFCSIGKLYNANTVFKTYWVSSTPHKALSFYFDVLRCGFVPDSYTFVSLFSCIGKIDSGKMCHGQAIKHGCDQVLAVQNSLMNMYTCCGALDLAKKVFVEIPKRDIVSWNSLMAGFVRRGDVCSARKLFDEMPERNLVSWNIMIDAYLGANNPGVSISLFREMVGEGNESTLVLLLKACGRSARLKEGRSVHASLIRTLVNSNVVVDTALVDMYGKCKEVELARRIFDSVSRRNRVTWNVMILAHSLHGNPEDGFELFEAMISGKRYYALMVEEFQIKPNFGHLWCMANLYSSAGSLKKQRDSEELARGRLLRCEDVDRVREIVKERKIGRVPGCGLVDLKEIVHDLRLGCKEVDKVVTETSVDENVTVMY
ncbi:hypothetical protein Bca52824_095142 [Brassica carinata]|uniref:Pentatricopeptide repeat-containing protein n=1 Tax=Brassica carinata TaxID=52824 RepID=A0A8X7TK22_BRACI|nr:hypothetical protein Bca52824_095142 [Brassica carinata]